VKLPRDLSGAELVKGLEKLGYAVVRQKGGHARLTTQRNGEHHITVPIHDALRIGTLAGILSDVAGHLGVDRDTLLVEIVG
jgi:predicted RNA binding protein YcfA (HicA-like mRNA interferase family)